ncbi:MAG: hypothetical protein ABUL58_01815 [Steroidobacter sp.]
MSCNEGKEIEWPNTSDFNSFLLLLKQKYPNLDSLSDDQVDESPWSCGFIEGGGYIIVSMVFSRVSEVGNFIWALLEKYNLIVFDPQVDKAYSGSNELLEIREKKLWWQF